MITSRPEIVGSFGVVTSTHWAATSVGMAVLEKGGNAFDAAVATGCVLHVVEPDQNGPGGDCPILLWSEKKAKPEVICGQGVAPGAITAQGLRDMGLEVVPGIGHLPAVVPGSFGAWMRLLADYGSLSLREVLTPAIEIASNGFLMKPGVAAHIANCAPFMTAHWPSSAAVYLPHGQAPAGNRLFELPGIASTFARIIDEAERAGSDRLQQIEAARLAWYTGFVAEAIDRLMREPVMDTSGEPHRGYLSGDDLCQWQAEIEDPITFEYCGYTVCKAGPWAQSPVFLQQLALLKGIDLEAMDPLGPDFVHTVQECAKLAFADREAFYGDPKFVEVPLSQLLSEAYNAERRKLVGEGARQTLPPGVLGGFGGNPRLRDVGSTNMAHGNMAMDASDSEPLSRTWAQYLAESHGDTCHFDIIDRWGNMVSATPSGGWLSGSPVVPELGFPVSARGQMFSLDEDHPNRLEPGKRPRTTLTPTLALHGSKPDLAMGSPGGDQQDQWTLHAFLRHIHHGMNLQEAIDAPSFYTNHVPSSFYPREWRPGHLAVEDHFPRATLVELQRRGHNLEIFERWGHYNSVTMASKHGKELRAGASPRRMQSCAIGR